MDCIESIADDSTEQRDEQCKNDANVQRKPTEDANDKIQSPMKKCDQFSSECTAVRIRLEHNYALELKLKTKTDEHKCVDCGYSTIVKSRLLRHRMEHCKPKTIKSKKCSICGKFFTHNGLRDHYRNFINPNRTFRGEHKRYTAEDHSILLKRLTKKMSNQN